jgi:hypothetical protein
MIAFGFAETLATAQRKPKAIMNEQSRDTGHSTKKTNEQSRDTGHSTEKPKGNHE